MAHRRWRDLGLFSVVALTALGISQLSSYLVTTRIPLGETVVVNEFLHLTHIRNMGGIFGIFQGQGWLFALLSVALISALVLYLAFSSSARRSEYLFFGFIAGGGASNVLDRVLHGSVVDFINIQQIPYWPYVFNTADMMVHVGLWPLLYLSLRHPHPPRNATPDTQHDSSPGR